MSSIRPRASLGRFFHKRDTSNETNESASALATSEQPKRSASNSRRREGQRRSLGEFVRSRSRSLSRTRHSQHRRFQSADIPATPNVPDGVNVPSRPRNRDSRPPQRPSGEHLPIDQGLTTLQATGPSVPPRASSLKLHENRKSWQIGNAVPIYTSMMRAEDPYSEEVADWNLVRHERPLDGQGKDLPAPLRVAKSHNALLDSQEPQRFRHGTPGNLVHKSDVRNLRSPADWVRGNETVRHEQTSTVDPNSGVRRITRRSLDKPLPLMPSVAERKRQELVGQDRETPKSGADSKLGQQRHYMVKESMHPADLSEVVDLTNTEQTHQYTNWAPAVTKEKRIVNTHEITEEAITREIHNHHVYHRVLPVVDIEVLPPRHFVVAESGGYKEISESEVPGGTNSARLQQLINEAVTKMLPENQHPSGPRQFTARTFEGAEGDYKEYTTPEGIKRTEQWWVHPPTLETGGQESGQTQPFHFGSARPEDDGLRKPTVAGPPSFSRQPHTVSGTSGERAMLPPESSSTQTVLPIRMRHGEVSA